MLNLIRSSSAWKLRFALATLGCGFFMAAAVLAIPARASAAEVNFTARESLVNEDAGTVNVTIAISEPQATAVTIHYSVTSTATDGSDFQHLSGIAQISAFSPAVQIPVTIIDDTVQENTEIIQLDIVSCTGATVGPRKTHTLSIKDNDIPLVNFSSSAASKSEGAGTVTAAVTLTKAAVLPVDIYYRVSGTAASGVDYDTLPEVLHIAPGATSASIPIKLIDNTVEDPTRTLILEI